MKTVFARVALLASGVLLLSACDSEFTSSSSSFDSSSNTSGEISSSNTVTSVTDSSAADSSGTIHVNTNPYGLVDSSENGVILHAWNWSMEAIKDALPDIAEAGYTTVQTSPMQPQKDYSPNQNWRSQWWKLYQPLGFSVAQKNNSIGTKDQLRDLCSEAEKYGIKIIVDVVSNHLAGGGTESFNSAVLEYEPEIYDQNLLHKGNGYASDDNIKSLLKGNIGDYPDLQTENKIVQNSVLDLLKEYVDCGVDGFRFDAAKHIETSHDGEYASDYWDTVIGGIEDYASQQDKDIWCYCEILNTPGKGRDINWYTDLMDVTDTVASWSILDSVRYKNVDKVKDEDIFGYEMPENSAVLWAESHDTYANDSHDTTYISQKDIDKAYAIAASRNDATALYFARPSDNTVMGQIGTYDWKSDALTQVNRFHNRFEETENNIQTDDGVYLNSKNSSDGLFGMVLVDCENYGRTVDMSVQGIPDGDYTDRISGNMFTVQSGKLTGTFGESGIAVLYSEDESYQTPSLKISDDGSSPMTQDTEIEIEISGADSCWYSINNGKRTSFDGKTSVTIEKSQAPVTLKIEATVDGRNYVWTYVYDFVSDSGEETPVSGAVKVEGIDQKYLSMQLLAWVWGNDNNGRWVTGTKEGSSFSFPVEESDTHFLLAAFETTEPDPDWDNCKHQTQDYQIPENGIVDGSALSWK